MDIYQSLKEHDSLWGQWIPMESHFEQIEVSVQRDASRILTSLLNERIKDFPSTEWGIQLSLQWKKRSVSRKQKRILLQQIVDSRLLLDNSDVKPEAEIFFWYSMYFITNEILEQSPSPFYLRDKRERQLVGLSLLLLKYGNWNFRETREEIDWLEEISTASLFGYTVSTYNTWQSRNQNYFPPDWISLRLDVVADPNTPSRGKPYSSYCKGYGMDRGRTQEGKTPICAELDGEQELDKSMVLWKDHELATLIYLVEISTW